MCIIILSFYSPPEGGNLSPLPRALRMQMYGLFSNLQTFHPLFSLFPPFYYPEAGENGTKGRVWGTKVLIAHLHFCNSTQLLLQRNNPSWRRFSFDLRSIDKEYAILIIIRNPCMCLILFRIL